MLGLAVCLTLLLPATAACLLYLVPAVLGWWRSSPAMPGFTRPRFAVLIPAHDEERSLPQTLRSLAAACCPADDVQVTVVADNCTDRTAEIARAAGVACVVRHDPTCRGKGHAIAFGLARILRDRPDVVLILDADCDLNPGALREFAAAFASGVDAVQACVRSRNADAGPAGYVAAVGAALDNAVAAGLDRLGRPVPLRGTGMAFRRELLERIPWDAFGSVEDVEYAARLRAAGVKPRLCRGAVVSCEAPAGAACLCRQRRRWRAAVRLRTWAGSKPLVLLHLLLTVAVSAAVGFRAWPAVLLLLTVGMYARAVMDVGLTRLRLGLLLRSPALVARLGWLTLTGLLRRTPTGWEHAPRLAPPRA